MGRSLVSELELEPVLRRVVEAAQELTGARYAALGILDEEKGALERFLFVGVDERTRERIGALPRGLGVLGELIKDPRPLRLADVGAHPRSHGFPAEHPPMTTFAGVPIALRGEAFGNLYLTDKHGGEEFDDADEEMLVVLAQWAAIAIENARLYEDTERQRSELERAVRGLEATVALSREVDSETELERVLRLIVDRGRALVDAGALLCLLTDANGVVVADQAGDVPDGTRGTRLDEDGSRIAEAMRGDASAHLDPASVVGELGVAPADALLAPLSVRGRRLGALLALARPGAGFDSDAELLLSSFATSAATAVLTAENVESERLQLAIAVSEQERRRWARELHDETLQELGALKLTHDGALVRGDPELMRRTLEQGAEQLARMIKSLESLITDLRPAVLDQLGIAAALQALIEGTRAAHEIRVDAEIDLAHEAGRADSRLTPELEAAVYRVVQEALNNAIKHAAADRVRVSATERGKSLTVVVEDDGSGFDPDRQRGRFGLVGMRERVLLAGGDLQVESGPGRGTRVVATLPVARLHERDGEDAVDGAGLGTG